MASSSIRTSSSEIIPTRCLVVETEGSGLSEHLRRALSPDRGFACELVNWAGLAHSSLGGCAADVVVAVAAPDTVPALRLFEWLERHAIRTPVLAVLPDPTGEGLMESAVKVVADFVVLPVREEELRHRIARLVPTPRHDVDQVRERLMTEARLRHLVGADPVFTAVVAQLPQIAASGMPVLILGETGTGKELCARAIHHLSHRHDRPFVAVDCGSIPDHLLENELYGHRRGAFTDAHRDQHGLVAMAEGGTLFLDEIDTLSLAAQAKLLRFLQEHVYRPLGSESFLQADVNVITATNQDLRACVRSRRFRPDLYYRLNVLTLALPPLRERPGDVLTLAYAFLQEARMSTGAGPLSFSKTSESLLIQHEWPGNVRELQNVVQRAVVAARSSHIQPRDLAFAEATWGDQPRPSQFRIARAAAVASFERRYVEELLQRHDGNVTHAAREAHKDRRAFGRLVKKYAIKKRGATSV